MKISKSWLKIFHWIVIFAAIAWGYQGLDGVNFQQEIFGTVVAKFVGAIVLVSGLISAYMLVSEDK